MHGEGSPRSEENSEMKMHGPVSERQVAEQLLAENREKDKLIEQLSREKAEAENLADKDPLTELYNRRGFLREVKNFRQDGIIAFFDADFFKRVNDTYGHKTGDDLLKKIAEYFKAISRPKDVIGRFGGEEFVIFYPATSVDSLMTKFESEAEGEMKVRVPFDFNDPNPEVNNYITFSVGLKEFKDGDDLDQALKRADEATYGAKESGRDQVVIAAEVEAELPDNEAEKPIDLSV